MAQSPCFLSPLADSPLLPFLVPFSYLETLLAVTGSVHLGLRLLVNWPPLSQPFPIPPHSKFPVPRLLSASLRQLQESGFSCPEQEEWYEGGERVYAPAAPATPTLKGQLCDYVIWFRRMIWGRGGSLRWCSSCYSCRMHSCRLRLPRGMWVSTTTNCQPFHDVKKIA